MWIEHALHTYIPRDTRIASNSVVSHWIMTQLQTPRHILYFGKPRAILTVIAISLVITFIFNSSLKESALLPWTSGGHSTVATYRYSESPPHLESHFPPPDPERRDYREWNARTMRDLHACIAQNNCGKNQQKVALLAAHWFQEAVVGAFRGGEGIWWV